MSGMDKKFVGWAFTILGGAITMTLIYVSLFAEGWGWITDMSRLPKYLLAGPLPLVGGLFALHDAYKDKATLDTFAAFANEGQQWLKTTIPSNTQVYGTVIAVKEVPNLPLSILVIECLPKDFVTAEEGGMFCCDDLEWFGRKISNAVLIPLKPETAQNWYALYANQNLLLTVEHEGDIYVGKVIARTRSVMA